MKDLTNEQLIKSYQTLTRDLVNLKIKEKETPKAKLGLLLNEEKIIQDQITQIRVEAQKRNLTLSPEPKK